MNDYQLNNQWDLWYHSIKDNNWEINSYQKIFMINNLFDYQIIEDIFQKNHYYNGMFFLMKTDILPIWEDPKNRLGGYISFKIYSNNLVDIWNHLVKKCISENIFNNNNNLINGISISPKKEFNIIKLWINEDIKNYKDHLNIKKEYINNSLYKKFIT